MTEHILPKEMVKLEGVYLEAFSKMHGLLEDSGWQLAKEPEEGQALELQEEPTEEQLQAATRQLLALRARCAEAAAELQSQESVAQEV